MAVDEWIRQAHHRLSPIRGGRWITMDSRPLDKRPISLCRAIIDSHQDPVIFAMSQTYHNFKQHSRYYFSFSADRADEIVGRFISLLYTSGPEPTGYGSSAFGKANSSEDYSQSPGRALMQDTAKSSYPDLPVVRENPFIKHRLSFANVRFVSTEHIGKDEPFLLQYRFIKELN
jgi:hypothetical protein